MNHEQIDRLPSRPGVYRFRAEEGNVIYIGKAKNIRKRVLGHFRSNSDKELELCAATSSIDFELTGNELIALLLESDLIQKHRPVYNAVQKKFRTAFHIRPYFNKKGILRMAVEEQQNLQPETELFFTRGEAKKRLMELCTNYCLCPKYSGLQSRKGRCSHINFPNCRGVCHGKELVSDYNQRAEGAIASLKADTKSFLIHEKGRKHGEQAFVLVYDGLYRGFGYVDSSQQICSLDELMDQIRSRRHTCHTAKILETYRKKHPARIRPLELIS